MVITIISIIMSKVGAQVCRPRGRALGAPRPPAIACAPAQRASVARDETPRPTLPNHAKDLRLSAF